MLGIVSRLGRNTDGTVAPTVALALIGLVTVGGVAFDYAHLAAMDTELQQAADQAALAAATQLDGKPGAVARATAAAQSLITNKSLLAGQGQGGAIDVPAAGIKFCKAFDDSNADTNAACTAAATDAEAKIVWVKTAGRTATYTLTPIVGLFNSGSISGEAVASLSSAICKTPPVMLCNPAEPPTNTNDGLPFTPTPGIGLKLVTGDATVPGNFGWLQSTVGNGASALAETLGYNAPPGACQPSDGVTTKTGMDKSVLNAFNTRFDLYANGNQTCPNQGGGTCSPSDVTRKDLVCGTNGANPTACQNNASWSEASKPYRLAGGVKADLTGAVGTDPTIMGYPPDECHMSPPSGACGVAGDGVWDRNAYFRVNYGWDPSTWQAQTGLSSTASRYEVYKWERAHPNPTGKGISVPQKDGTTSNFAFGQPATGVPGVAPTGSQADRRVIAVAVLNCQSLSLHGKSTAVPVTTWMDVFLVQPVASRSGVFSDSNIYVEEIGTTTRTAADSNPVVLRRDRPYLIR
ncbi:MAG TPA: pilus assembly protein TadG-related protein [Sphingomicrobium sp.]|nr:pilus assembly protein TadG-related protein [Sphingomicrobium sp.]